eukprot:jgi/Mesvir1/29004/Mv17771-RA.1
MNPPPDTRVSIPVRQGHDSDGKPVSPHDVSPIVDAKRRFSLQEPTKQNPVHPTANETEGTDGESPSAKSGKKRSHARRRTTGGEEAECESPSKSNIAGIRLSLAESRRLFSNSYLGLETKLSKIKELIGDYFVPWSSLVLRGPLGVGATSTVSLCLHKPTNTMVAVKDFHESLGPDFKDNMITYFASEALLMRSLDHPNLVQFVGAGCHIEESRGDSGRSSRGSGSGRDPSIQSQVMRAYVVMKYISGPTLGSLFINRKIHQYPLKARIKWALDVAQGMAYLHGNHHPDGRIVMHRDLKLDNIMLDQTLTTAVIVDLGLSKLKEGATMDMTAQTGSLRYMAPEVFHGKYSELCDVFSFGIILGELVSGERAYSHVSDTIRPADFPMAIMDGLRPQLPQGLPPPVLNLILSCWSKREGERLPFHDVVEVLRNFLGGPVSPRTPKKGHSKPASPGTPREKAAKSSSCQCIIS